MDAAGATVQDSPSQPTRLVGVVDIGANSVRLAIAQVSSSHDIDVLDDEAVFRPDREVGCRHGTAIHQRRESEYSHEAAPGSLANESSKFKFVEHER